MLKISLDFETWPIGPGSVAPLIVCGTFATKNEDGTQPYDAWLYTRAEDLEQRVTNLLEMAVRGEALIITHNGGFDYSCICATWPHLISLVFNALFSGNCTDTLWREKLLNLSTHGRLDSLKLPDGSSTPLRYNLAVLERIYLGIDRSAEKDNPEESWRANYCMLEGWRAEEYPEDASRYAIEDAIGTLRVYEAQEDRKAQFATASTATEEHKLLSSFCLYLETAWGMEVNQQEVARVRGEVDRIIDENKGLLLAFDILRPDKPARPHVHAFERAVAAVREMGEEADAEAIVWGPYVERLRDLGIKCTEPVPGSIDTKELQAYAERVYQKLGVIPKLTDGGKSGKKKICLDAEVVDFLAADDPIFEQYSNRQALSKIRTGQLPVLESAPVVHFCYNALVETGRTSSYGSDLFPSTNGQNVPKEIEGIDPRRCYRPRAGRVFFDVDISNLELACVGQITFDLFGASVHKDLYNAGCDLHSYLAAQILLRTQGEGVVAETAQFVASCVDPTPLNQYRRFLELKKGSEEQQQVFTHYRNLAKPIGLGFPGGIGPKKMCELAWKDYRVKMTEKEAYALREIWRATYPEMPRYFDWVEGQVDHLNHDEEGSLYQYTTPMGMHRRGATFCSLANGMAMQSPGAEVATIGNIQVVRACYDEAARSVLYGCRPIAFVHDQVIGETTLDPERWHAQAMEVSHLMIEAGKIALPDMALRTEPLLTSVWSKSAKPTFDEAGKLIPWYPKQREGEA